MHWTFSITNKVMGEIQCTVGGQFSSNIRKTSLSQHVSLLIKSKLRDVIFFDFASFKQSNMLAPNFVQSENVLDSVVLCYIARILLVSERKFTECHEIIFATPRIKYVIFWTYLTFSLKYYVCGPGESIETIYLQLEPAIPPLQ